MNSTQSSTTRLFCAVISLSLALAPEGARASYQSTVLSQGPVGFWRLNETTPPLTTTVLATNIGTVGAPGNGTFISAQRGLKPGALAGDTSNAAIGFAGLDTNRVRIPFRPEWNPSSTLTVEFL